MGLKLEKSSSGRKLLPQYPVLSDREVLHLIEPFSNTTKHPQFPSLKLSTVTQLEMSSKSSNEKPDTSKRVPALDVMVTRHQSAQQKRQLRKMDRSMKKITSLLKSPERTSPKKSTTNKSATNKKPISPPSTVNKNPATKTVGAASSNKSNSVSPKTYRGAVSVKSTLTKDTAIKLASLPNTSSDTKSLSQPETNMVTNIDKTSTKPAIDSSKSVLNTSTMPLTEPVARSHGRRIKVLPKMTPKLVKQNKLKVVRKTVKQKNTGPLKHTQGEYYPNTKKRKGTARKVKLRHKFALKCIGKPGSSKRKLTIPRKGSKQPPQPHYPATTDPEPAWSLSPDDEMLLMMQEIDRSLTDEDMMELLTCPSPVWWEDPPDPSYTEGPIYTRRGKKIYYNPRVSGENRKRKGTAFYELNDEPAAKTSRTDDVSVLREISTAGRDENFNKKRNILEGLLSNIKSKKVPKEMQKSYKDKTDRKEATVLNEITGTFDENYPADNSDNDEVVLISCQNSENIKKGTPKKDTNAETENPTKSGDNISIISIASSKCSETSFNCAEKEENDILNDLENLEIPIKHMESTECIILDDEDDKPNEISILDSPVSVVEENMQMSLLEGSGEVKVPEFKLRYLTKADSPKTLIWTSNDGDKKIINLVNDAESVTADEATGTEPCVVPRDLPPLQKFQKVAKVTRRISNDKCSVTLGDTSYTVPVKVGMTDDQISEFVSAVKQTDCNRNIEKINLLDPLVHPDLVTTSSQVDLTTDEVFDLTIRSPTHDVEIVEDVKATRISSDTVKSQIKSVYKQFFQTDKSKIARITESEVKENRHIIDESISQNSKQHRLNVYKIIDKTDDEKSDKVDGIEIVGNNKESGVSSGTIKPNKQQTISKLKSVYKQFFIKDTDKKETTQNVENEVKENSKQHRLSVYKIIDKTDDEKSDNKETTTEQLSQSTSKDAKRLAMLTKTDETLTKLVRKQPYVIKVRKNMLDQVMQAYAT